MTTGRHVVAAVAELPPGQRRLVRLNGRDIGVFNVGGAFYALLNRCPHQGGPLCEGTLVGFVSAREPGRFDYSRPGELLKCPWHGWAYDVRTGQSWCDPGAANVKLYPVTVVAGEQLVQGPFVAETFAVSVEQDYIVVEI